MNKNIFFDAIMSIQINNGLVKLVMGNQDASQPRAADDKTPPALTAENTVVLPVNSFIYALAVFINDEKNQEMIAKMQEAAGINKTASN